MINQDYIEQLRLDCESNKIMYEYSRQEVEHKARVIRDLIAFQDRYRVVLYVLTMVFIISSQFTWEHFKLMAVIYAGIVLFLEAELKSYDVIRMSIQVWWEARKCS
ncbi:hypothetical protein [Algicola sagamiensis]|uniref:hypothetical protein n=1 Tax=Algicola sagamiensis TaxID=163869 RepID=UPI000366003E|nr:hypothetical protein [Algicola sagamiensis]